MPCRFALLSATMLAVAPLAPTLAQSDAQAPPVGVEQPSTQLSPGVIRQKPDVRGRSYAGQMQAHGNDVVSPSVGATPAPPPCEPGQTAQGQQADADCAAPSATSDESAPKP